MPRDRLKARITASIRWNESVPNRVRCRVRELVAAGKDDATIVVRLGIRMSTVQRIRGEISEATTTGKDQQ